MAAGLGLAAQAGEMAAPQRPETISEKPWPVDVERGDGRPLPVAARGLICSDAGLQ